MIAYASDTSSWEEWKLEYLFGAFYIFPPDDVIVAVDALRTTYDATSAAICQAHVSLSRPVPHPLTAEDLMELTGALREIDPFVVQYGPLRSFPPHPGVVYEIAPEESFRALRSTIHGTSVFDGVDLRREDAPPHMTVAEFISVGETEQLLGQLQGNVPIGEFTCDRIEYAVPDANFRFQRLLAIPLPSRG
jgi:2'-5' RNA ligase